MLMTIDLLFNVNVSVHRHIIYHNKMSPELFLFIQRIHCITHKADIMPYHSATFVLGLASRYTIS